MTRAPSAQQFWDYEHDKRNRLRPFEGKVFDHADYMDFAERYGDFIAEFEKNPEAASIRAIH